MALAKLTGGLRNTEEVLWIFRDIDPNEDRVLTVNQGTKRLVSCYQEILCEKTYANTNMATVRCQ